MISKMEWADDRNEYIVLEIHCFTVMLDTIYLLQPIYFSLKSSRPHSCHFTYWTENVNELCQLNAACRSCRGSSFKQTNHKKTLLRPSGHLTVLKESWLLVLSVIMAWCLCKNKQGFCFQIFQAEKKNSEGIGEIRLTKCRIWWISTWRFVVLSLCVFENLHNGN